MKTIDPLYSYDVLTSFPISFSSFFWSIALIFITVYLYLRSSWGKCQFISVMSLVLIIMIGINFIGVSNWFELKGAAHKGKFKVINGTIEDYKNIGRPVESFKVSGIWFSFKVDSNGGFYSKSYSSNRYLNIGSEVRISYASTHDGIVKLDILSSPIRANNPRQRRALSSDKEAS